MRFFGKRYNDVTSDDIAGLLANKVEESMHLEFKAKLPDARDEPAKGKVVRSVVAMANTEGGVILFGVDESDTNGVKQGFAAQLHDIGEGLDEAGRRLGGMLATKVDPPITTQARPHLVTMPDGKRILVLGVSRSIAAPHAELYREQIPRRAERMTVVPRPSELRRMFLESESMFEECEQFVAQRLSRLKSIPMPRARYAAVHILPIGRLRESIDIRGVNERSSGAFRALGGRMHDVRYNAEGFVCQAYPVGTAQAQFAHTQVFRFGGLEGVSTEFVGVSRGGDENKRNVINGPFVSGEIRKYVRGNIEQLIEHASGTFPFYVALTLEAVHGAYVLGMGQFMDGSPIDIARVQASAVVEDHSDIELACLSLTRILWQAGGYADDFSVAKR